MAARVSYATRSPRIDPKPKAGDSVEGTLYFTNGGDVEGNFYYEIMKDGSRCVSKYNYSLGPGKRSETIRCNFSMPNKTVKLTFNIGLAESGVWVKKYTQTTTISVGAETGRFKVYVRDRKTYTPISNAKVVSQGVTKYTDSSGYTGYFGPYNRGKSYSYNVSRSEYNSSSGVCYLTKTTQTDTILLTPTCDCGSWTNKECVRTNYRWQTRACTPSGCKTEEREVYDTSCKAPCVCGGWVDKECVATGKRKQTRTCTPSGCENEERLVNDFSCEQVGKGVITICNINALPCPDCGNARKGEEIKVIAEMRNDGGDAEFRFYIYDQDGNELSKEPDLTYKNVAMGATWKIDRTMLTNLNFKMLGKDLNGILKLVRQI